MSWRLEKTRAELEDARQALNISWHKRTSWRDTGHFFLDIFVECCRHAPYTVGRLIGIYVVWKAVELVATRLTQ